MTPTLSPTQEPSLSWTKQPTMTPSLSPTEEPTKEPTLFPTEQHTIEQTTAPSQTLNYVSLVVILTGVSESNKDDICAVLAKAIGGIVTLCFLESPSRRTLQEKASEVNLFMEINVEDAATARLQVESNGFLESLDFPEGITAESLVLSS